MHSGTSHSAKNMVNLNPKIVSPRKEMIVNSGNRVSMSGSLHSGPLHSAHLKNSAISNPKVVESVSIPLEPIKSPSVWMSIPCIDLVGTLVDKKVHCLHSNVVLGEVWGDQLGLSKLYLKLQKRWKNLHYFQLISASSFVIIFDSPSICAEVLGLGHHWFGNHLVSVSKWKPFFVPACSKKKFIPF